MFKNLSLSLVVIATISGADARHHHHHRIGHSTLVGGIDKDDLMQNQKSHWRKLWPQGDTDTGEDDENVLNLAGKPRKAKKKPDVYTYPWTLDADIVDSQKHLKDSETVNKREFGVEGYQDRGLGILNSGDKHIKSWYL